MRDALIVQLPGYLRCPTCDPGGRVISSQAHVGLETLFDDRGEIIGLQSVAWFPYCGHRMPWVRFLEDEVALALESNDDTPMLRAQAVDLEDEDGED
jgi:hypothetical protein